MTTTRTPPARCPRDHTCPNVRSHDSYSAWRYGCPSPAAEADAHRYYKLRAAGLHPHQPLPSGPSTRRLRACAARGWRTQDIAEHSPMTRSQIASILRGARPTVTQHTARRCDEVFRKLWWRDGPSQWVRTYAAHQGWAPAAAYDDLDDMAEKPKTGRRPKVPAGHAEAVHDRRATIARLTAQGRTAQQIAWDLGITPRSVTRHLAKIAAQAQAA